MAAHNKNTVIITQDQIAKKSEFHKLLNDITDGDCNFQNNNV